MRDPHAAETAAALKSLAADGSVARPDLPYHDVLLRPAAELGPFDSLSASAQAYLRRFCREEDAVRALADGRLSAALVQCGASVSRVLYAAERAAARLGARAPRPWQPPAERVRQALRRTARKSTHLPFVLRRWAHREVARLRLRAGRRDLATILRARGFDHRQLAFEYLAGLEQLPGCISVLHRPQARVTYAVLMGLDFVRSGDRLWFLEANCNPVLMDARLALHAEADDPWVNNLLGCVRRRGYRRLVVYGYRPFRHGHTLALQAAAQRAGIQVDVFDDIFFRRHPGHARAWLMQNGVADAFVLRAKTFDVLFDRAILSKRQTRDIVTRAGVDWSAAGLAMPPVLTSGAPAPNYDPAGRFPNIVGKREDLDRGAGVSFYKLPRVPDLAAEGVDYFEEYRVPDPCRQRVVRGEQIALPPAAQGAWKIRSYAVLTPDGIEYLSSIKVISGLPIPERLPDGKVTRKSIFLATINEGGVYSAVTAAEDEEYQRAVAAVGDALLGWVKFKFEPDFNRHPIQ